MAKLTVKDVELKGKKVLVRVDFNVPVKDGVITNDNRITAALPTIKYILEQGGRAILFSHLGRVKEEADKEGKSLAPVAADLAAKLGQDVKFIPGVTRGAELEAAVNSLEDGQVLLVENTRFEDVDGKKESKNDPELGKYWASLGDGIFVNDAFGTAHRAHASNVGISANVEKAVAGFLLENEIAYIQEAVENPERPFVAILGGSKVSDKIGVIENLLEKADKVLIGGGMTYTFFKAQGIEIGNSLVEEDKLDVAKALLEKSNGKLILPVDSKEANAFADYTEVKYTEGEAVDPGFLGLDIGPKSIAKFDEALTGAKTVVWNGPMGVFENPDFQAGTIGVMDAIVKQPGVKSIIGGGDSAAAAINLGYADKFSWISTGGGASMELLEGKELPGLAALTEK
ncbi:phosphoglycerate kinase [Streptococcus thermophilus]|uniref:Phosphoglycerate kinase n=1 Tax=Streptococcus thermophilus (strain ATCC BAA-250 / LMG 18311) TaxID=264199 RepID=PGK_STRT2|nr:phosphoglycerate kinase [Streptococcus thermophilus]Q8VVB6.1 RecName: Full=Phosphoglycerate kinase [Streptococcus thermophilus LMG 18311]AAL35380.1 phosphoglycerate kinase [Streptococcus thermophilus LMG 18311]AAV61381.1 phosphoglycerate kinase [Streptococcus thermophilus LMG 18311]MCE2188616.1 phosphoglycerate kinase [Streptococcus thermophilus]MCE2273694.1 phosphoglycerate kinase [Streptococcus thermophilus]MCT2924791.1 phosphoglycerate kinase [Streptococcus thermophilus]